MFNCSYCTRCRTNILRWSHKLSVQSHAASHTGILNHKFVNKWITKQDQRRRCALFSIDTIFTIISHKHSTTDNKTTRRLAGKISSLELEISLPQDDSFNRC